MNKARTGILAALAFSLVATGCGRTSTDGMCEPGYLECDHLCVDPSSDPENCGGCDQSCTPAEVCSQGSCEPTCIEGLTDCGGSCVNIRTHPEHCGACFNACAMDETCIGGSCESGMDETCIGGSCESGNDPVHYAAQQGNSQFMLPDPTGNELCGEESILTDCGGVCVNTQTDRSHCGACFNACPAGIFCRSGACTSSCPAGLTNCDGMCVNLQIIKEHCGACNRSCEPDEMCKGGECRE